MIVSTLAARSGKQSRQFTSHNRLLTCPAKSSLQVIGRETISRVTNPRHAQSDDIVKLPQLGLDHRGEDIHKRSSPHFCTLHKVSSSPDSDSTRDDRARSCHHKLLASWSPYRGRCSDAQSQFPVSRKHVKEHSHGIKVFVVVYQIGSADVVHNMIRAPRFDSWTSKELQYCAKLHNTEQHVKHRTHQRNSTPLAVLLASLMLNGFI